MLNLISSKAVKTFAMSIGIAAVAFVGSAIQIQAQTVSSGIDTPQNLSFQITDAISLREMEQAIFNRINNYRVSKGLRPMMWNADIAQQAREHSRNMAKKIVPFGHQGFDQRAKAIDRSVNSRGTGENVAWVMSRRDPAGQAVDAWIKSPHHLDNIVGDFSMTGIGIGLSSHGEYYFTQEFVRK